MLLKLSPNPIAGAGQYLNVEIKGAAQSVGEKRRDFRY